MKKILAVATILLGATMVFAQSDTSGTTSITDADTQTVGNDAAKNALREVSVDLFEREASWSVNISPDYGVITGRMFDGGPAAKEPLDDPENSQKADTKVLGVKTQFYRRGTNSFYITAARPIPIEGVTKTISLWVTGRNQDHQLYIEVEDYFGKKFDLFVGSLGYSGWKKLTVAIPPSPDGERGIVQQSAYYGSKPGLKVVGFRIDCNPSLARGAYYVYFDDMRAVTDLYDLENRDEDDMLDDW